MKLLELFDSKVKYEIQDKSPGRFFVTSQVGDREIGVFFYRDSGNIWEIIFAQRSKNSESWSHALTGSGEEFKVFSLVKSALDDFLKRYRNQVDVLYCTANKTSNRAQIYEKMLKKVKGFTLEVNKDGDNYHPDSIILTLKKNAK